MSATSASDIVEHVERSMTAGILAPGMRLAPVRQLAEATGLAPNTVAAAYRTLAARGVVEGRGRHGTFIAAHAGIPQAHAPIPEGMVDLATGNPDPRLLPDLGLHMGRIDTSHVLYGEAQVDPSLERLARGLLEGMGGDSTPLAVVHGALDGVERTLQVRLRVGDAVALEAPGWPAFADLVTALGMRPVPVEVDDRGMIPDRLGRVAGDVAAVIITPRFQNPTGAALDDIRAAELRSVLDPYPDLLVIEDDHGGLIAGVPLAPVAAGRGRWAHVQSFSKSLGPDLRMAILTGDEGTLTALKARQSAGPGWVSHLLQRLVASILEDPSTAGLLQRAIDSYTARRMGLIAALAERGVPALGRTGINVWIPVPEEEPVVAAMAGAGYAIRAGERWRMGTPPAVRLSISALADDRIDEVAAIVATSVGARTGSRTTRSG